MPIEIREATPSDTPDLAGLRWSWSAENDTPVPGDLRLFTAGFTEWWSRQTDLVTLVVVDDEVVVGMGFLALAERVPDPTNLSRRHGDIQSVYVLPEHRGRGIGSMLVRALIEHGVKSACIRLTVHSGSRAIPVYERAGFEHSEHLMLHSLSDHISPPR